ncbi:uncharacterized protein PAC_06819 [Phialocephala subalpina]|uniref:Uncharacterized protein n=1 Tax=Phialocephala subalpina TaxID=576137 RepID=A0A1L7WVX4_9HELO|nr:uncharacterized protein PAC_06819 [Phialocephala subalpina]
MGLGGLKDQLGAWQATLSFILAASLVTTSIVAGLTPKSIVYVTDSTAGYIYTLPDQTCINDSGQNSVAGQWFSWTLPDGSNLSYDQDPGIASRLFCDAGVAEDLLIKATMNRPELVGYILADSLVFPNAAGVPWGFSGLGDVFGTIRTSSFLWASRCLPVLQQNPVRCFTAGNTTIESTGVLSVTNGDCKIVGKSLHVNLSSNSAAVLGACTKNHPIGKATILLGATTAGRNSTSYGFLTNDTPTYAGDLAQAVGDNYPTGRSTYAVTCQVDLTQAVGLRMLNYSRSDSIGQWQQVGTIYDTDQNEVTLEQILGNGALATGAGAVAFTGREYTMMDGLIY